MKDIVLATRNRHKTEEIRALLAGLPVHLRALDEAGVRDELVEDGDTFRENAAAKAEQASAASGAWAIADDSGLELPELGGRPGVRSARFAGPAATDAENNAKLLAEMKARGIRKTLGFFRCAAALRITGPRPALERLLESGEFRGLLPRLEGKPEVSPDGRTITVEGEVPGLVVDAPRGGGGFGYDPLFYMQDLGKTMAELSREEKNRVSHRSRAFRALRVLLDSLLAAEARR